MVTRKCWVKQVAIFVASAFWLPLGFSYQYAEKYQVLFTVPRETKELTAGEVTRLNADPLINRYSGVKFKVNSIRDSLAEASEHQARKAGGKLEAIKHYCNYPARDSSGHPVEILQIICNRSKVGEVDIKAHPFSTKRITTELALSIVAQWVPLAAAATMLSKSYSYNPTKLPTSDELEKAHPDEYKSREDDPIRRIEWIVKDNQLPARDPEAASHYTLNEDRELESGSRRTKIGYKYLSTDTAKAYYDKFDADIPHVLFLTSADEEQIHHPRHLVLPFPNVLIETEKNADGCTRPFEMPTIRIEHVSPLSSLSHSLTGKLAMRIDQQECLPEKFRKSTLVQDAVKKVKDQHDEQGANHGMLMVAYACL